MHIIFLLCFFLTSCAGNNAEPTAVPNTPAAETAEAAAMPSATVTPLDHGRALPQLPELTPVPVVQKPDFPWHLLTVKTDFSEMRDKTSQEIVLEMGIGINLGNTMDATGDWISRSHGIRAFERAWGSPIIIEEMIAGYALAGFDSVRIPVSWSNLMAEDFTIHPELMDRVEEITQWVLKYGMYAIVNLHHDMDWVTTFSTNYDECYTKYTAIWRQVSERFKDYGDFLILEGMNEEGVFNDLWNRWGGTQGKAEAFALLNDINQIFVDTVRASGGNNANRHLLVAGYATDIKDTANEYFNMPDDPANRLMLSLHYYTPPTFAILDADASWGKARTEWGDERDLKELNDLMDLAKTYFVDNGIPVIIGEYGANPNNKTDEMVRHYIATVCEAVFVRGMCPMIWSVPGQIYDRQNARMYDPLLEEAFKEIAKLPRR
jgi:endoglucanase